MFVLARCIAIMLIIFLILIKKISFFPWLQAFYSSLLFYIKIHINFIKFILHPVTFIQVKSYQIVLRNFTTRINGRMKFS